MAELLYLTWELHETRSVSRQSSLRGGDLETVHLDQEWIGLAINQRGQTMMSLSCKTEQEMREKLPSLLVSYTLIWEDPANPSVGFGEILKRLK